MPPSAASLDCLKHSDMEILAVFRALDTNGGKACASDVF
jgi:hypothetical protein